MSRHLLRLTSVVKQNIHNYGIRHFFWRVPGPFINDLGHGLRQMDQYMKDMDRRMNRVFDDYTRPEWWYPSKDSSISTTDGIHKIKFYVGEYKPEDIKITVNGNIVKVSAKMENIDGDGIKTYSEFSKECKLPENVKLDTLKSFLNQDANVLTVEVKQDIKTQSERIELPITDESKK